MFWCDRGSKVIATRDDYSSVLPYFIISHPVATSRGECDEAYYSTATDISTLQLLLLLLRRRVRLFKREGEKEVRLI
jgi:hypothetical protein